MKEGEREAERCASGLAIISDVAKQMKISKAKVRERWFCKSVQKLLRAAVEAQVPGTRVAVQRESQPPPQKKGKPKNADWRSGRLGV